MGVTATTRLPAGWYPDPEGGNQRRWWDGQEWTQYTAEFQRPSSVDELHIEPAADPPTKPGKPARVARRLRRVEDSDPEVRAGERRSAAERLGRWVAGAVHLIPSTRKRRRAHRSGE